MTHNHKFIQTVSKVPTYIKQLDTTKSKTLVLDESTIVVLYAHKYPVIESECTLM